ncbi:MAG: hypothetical protein PVI22_14405 [Lysobacterales bacterium]|jgi:hypothetical protein
MEYVYYVLFICAIMAASLYLLRLTGMRRLKSDQVELAERARRRKARLKQQSAKTEAHEDRKFRHRVLSRDLSKVPVPWGWPGHQGGHVHLDGEDSVGASLHRWVDQLVREKRTIDDQEFVSRKAASLRALMEDRYGRASTMEQMSYKKVKAPLLRDPSAPHDQMDNFPSGKTASITKKLSRQPAVSTGALAKRSGPRKVSGLKNLRTPWGW